MLTGDRYLSWMPTRQGYQRHDIVPNEFGNHPFIQRANINIKTATNMTCLPVADGIRPTKATHANLCSMEELCSEYNKKIGGRLDASEQRAIKDQWSNQRVTQEMLKLQRNVRKNLDKRPCP